MSEAIGSKKSSSGSNKRKTLTMRGTFFYLHRALPLTPQLPCLSALFEFDFHSFVLNSWFHHGSLTTLPDHLVSEWRAFFARISLACLPLGRARSIVSGRATRVKSASVKNPLRLSSFPKQKARSRQRIQIWRSCSVIYSRFRRIEEHRLWENRNFFRVGSQLARTSPRSFTRVFYSQKLETF